MLVLFTMEFRWEGATTAMNLTTLQNIALKTSAVRDVAKPIPLMIALNKNLIVLTVLN